MATSGIQSGTKDRLFAAAFALAFALACLALGGCVTNDDTLMPWASPAPGEGTVPIPSSLLRE